VARAVGTDRRTLALRPNKKTQYTREMTMEVSGIVGLLILIADVYAILQIAQSASSNGNKVLWIVLVLILPLLGLILWFLFGPKAR
jgi:hypothetical protein